MQTESSISFLIQSLNNNPSIVHKKALTIIQTILKTMNAQIQNQSQDNVNLIILTLLYKQYKQSTESQNIQNSTSYLLLINHLLPQVNTESLESAGVLTNLKDLTVKMLSLSNKNLLGFRYCISVLTELVLCSQAQESEYNISVIYLLLDMVLKSNKSIERKEASKNLRLILDKYPTFGNDLAQQTKRLLEQNTSSHIYIHSLKSIIEFYPVVLLNDICYLLRPYLRVEEDSYNEQFIVQAYFFLQAVMDMQLITGDISEEILKQLIHNIPLGGDNKMMYGYLQCIHESFITLNRANELTSLRYLSSVVSVVSQMLIMNGRIPKQAQGILKEVIGQGVSQTLWIKNHDDLDLGNLELQGDNNSFKKLVAMLQDLLSTRYDDKRHSTFSILKQFFSRLDQTAYEQVESLVIQIIQQRDRFQIGQFNELFGAVIQGVGHAAIFKLLPLTIAGDPTQEQFQSVNNLWLLQILSKNSPACSFQYFIDIIFPLLQQTHQLRLNPQQNKLRQTIYHQLNHKLWATLANMYGNEKRYQNWQPCIEYIEANIVDKYEQLPLVLNGLIQLLTHQTINPQYFSSKAEKFIPTLAKILDLNNQKQSINILKSIRNLSKVCNPSYLDRVFLKNLSKLLLQVQNGTLLENQQVNSKNIQILMAISYGVNFRDQSMTTLNNQQFSKLEGILEFLKSFIQQKNIFQKKAYKFMLQCFEFMPEGYLYEVKDLVDKQIEILPSSRSYRLGVLHALWNNHKYSQQNCNIENSMGFIKEYLPQIVLMLKQPNQKVRKLAHGMLTKILKTMNNFGIIESFLQMMSAGLASVSSSGKVDTINALTLSLSSLDIYSHAQFAQDLTDVVLVLLQESKPDILKAVINYLKKYIFLFPNSKQNLPEIMKGIFQTDENSRLHILHLVKRLLLKLVKRDSKDAIMKVIPLEHQRLLKSIMKQEGKKKREQRRKQFNRLQEKAKDNESSDEEDQIPKHGSNMNQMEIEENINDKKKDKNNLLLKYDLDKERFHFVDGKRKQSKSRKTDKQAEEDDIAFIDGKLIIKESALGKRKRPQQIAEDQDDDDKQENKYNSKKSVKTNDSALHQIKESGSSYKAARAQGDLRIKNKPQPHAFIQLNPKALNKRYKQKADKVFEEFFQKKQGGLKGLKAKIVKRK